MAFAVYFSPGLLDQVVFDPKRVTVLSVITCLFAHQNLLHLLANMVFLAAVGPLVEFTRGGWRFAMIYVVGGLFGVLAHFIFSRMAPPGSPLLGASGSIAACVGYCVIRFARTKVPILPNIGVPVGLIGISWLLIQAAGSMVQIGDQMRGGIAYWAHLGGFLSGLAFAFFLGGLRDARHEYGHEVLAKMNERGPAAVLAAAEALLKQQPKNRTAQWERIQALSELGERKKLSSAVDQFIIQATDSELDAIIRILEENNLLAEIRSVQRLKYADRLASQFPEVQKTLLYSIIRNHDDVRRPEAMVSIIELLPDDDAERLALIGELTEQYPDHEATVSARQRGSIE